MWDNAIDELVKIAWEEKVCSRYRDMISEIKRKGKKPNFIDQDLWERWQCYWNTPKTKKIHETYSKNRMDLQLTLEALLLIMTMGDDL